MDQPSQQSIHSLKQEQYKDSLSSTDIKIEPKVEIDEINEVLNLIELKGYKHLEKYLIGEVENIKNQLVSISGVDLMFYQGKIRGMREIFKRIVYLKQQRELYKSPDKR